MQVNSIGDIIAQPIILIFSSQPWILFYFSSYFFPFFLFLLGIGLFSDIVGGLTILIFPIVILVLFV